MHFLYRILSSAVYYTILPYGRLRAGYGSMLWRGRLGLIEPAGPVDIWIHAASVGETKVATYLINYLLQHNRRLEIYLSTMTRAGHKVALDLEGRNISTGFFPIDSVPAISKTITKLSPRLVVITETEIWPNLIEAAAEREIPVILMNGRMSAKAFGRYKLARKLLARLLSKYEKFFLKTHADKEKYQSFGVSDDCIIVTGDMKFDAPMPDRSEGRIKEIRHRLGAAEDDFILVAGSTRPGEEEMLLDLFDKLKRPDGSFRMVIAPRHLQRIEELKDYFRERGVKFCLYDRGMGSSPLALVDRMGSLNDLYLAADLAFVGGSFVDIGGHNILEPVWAGTPVVFGPYNNNVLEAKVYILDNNYGAVVNDIEEMTQLVSSYIKGEISFAIKNESDSLHSPTAKVGEYILSRLKSA